MVPLKLEITRTAWRLMELIGGRARDGSEVFAVTLNFPCDAPGASLPSCRVRIFHQRQQKRPGKANLQTMLIQRFLAKEIRSVAHEMRKRDGGDSFRDTVRQVNEIEGQGSV